MKGHHGHVARRRTGIGAILLVLLGGAIDDAGAVETVGAVDVVVGAAQASGGQEPRPLQAKDVAVADEVIETGPDSATRIRLDDGSELSIGPDTRVVIRSGADQAGGKPVLDILAGVVEFAPSMTLAQRYEIRTPWGVLAPSGGRFGIDVAKGAVYVIEGQVAVRLADGRAFELQSSQCAGGANGAEASQDSGPNCVKLMSGYLDMLAMLDSAGTTATGAVAAQATSAAASFGTPRPSLFRKTVYLPFASPDRRSPSPN